MSTTPKQALVEAVAAAMWTDYADRRRLITPTAAWNDLIQDWKEEERRRARIAIDACRVEEMLEVLTRIASYPDANIISDAHYVARKQARDVLAKLAENP